MQDNEHIVLYFYCDDMHEVDRRDRSLSPQLFRSRLFSRMFERYVSANQMSDMLNVPIEIEADREIYIHLIARRAHLHYVSALKDAIKEMESK